MADANLGNPANAPDPEYQRPHQRRLVFLTTGITIARPVRLDRPPSSVNGADSNTIASAVARSAASSRTGPDAHDPQPASTPRGRESTSIAGF